MFPTLCYLGPVPLHSYGLMLAIAVLVASWLFAREAGRIGVSSDMAYDLVFWVVLCGIVGARLFYIGLEFDYFRQTPLEMLMIQKGGLAWQGSFIGGILAGFVYIKKNRLPLGKMLDIAAPFIALGQAIGRVGCLLNGCCYGKPAAWGLFFPVWGERLIPTQVFMALDQLAIFILLRFIAPRVSAGRSGQVFILYLLLSSVERFVIEFFRADHVLYVGFSVAQYVCVAIAAVAVGLLVYRKRS